MEFAEYEDRMRTETEGRYDVTPLFRDPDLFSALVEDLLAPVEASFDAVAGVEALGFVLGTAVAREAGRGFVPIRKRGTLPLDDEELLRASLGDDPDEAVALEVVRASVADSAVLLVDDWVETGGQLDTAAELVEEAGGSVAAATVLRVAREETAERLRERFPVHAVG